MSFETLRNMTWPLTPTLYKSGHWQHNPREAEMGGAVFCNERQVSQITTISKFVYSHQPCLTRQQRHQTSSTLGFPDYSPRRSNHQQDSRRGIQPSGSRGTLQHPVYAKMLPQENGNICFFLQLPHLSPSPLSPPIPPFPTNKRGCAWGGHGCVVRPKKRLSDFKPPSYVLLKCHSCLSGHEPEFTKASFSLCLIHSFPTLWLSGRLTDQD